LQNESERKGDWLAIPHELGHYVFWHLAEPENLNRQQQAVKDEVQRAVQQALGNQQLDDLLAQSLEPILVGWTEELFADVMGTYLGGEPFLDSLKLLIRHNIGNSDELRISDVSHPHHCLRPMVRLHVLKHLGVDVTKQEAEWDAFFRETLGVARLAQLKLRANSPTLITDPAKLNKAAALAMLSGQPTVAFTAAQVRPALEAAIDSLCQTADRVLAAGLQIPPIDPSLAFEQLQLQSPAATKAGPAPYLTLLQPRTLQGGDWHSHGAWVLDGHPWWTWHDCGVHFH
jgi:hypothetical protein